ncbi:MAG: hypothetical protein P8N63_06155 [Pseudomonadales bacterium]|nr:hypothetical protein [Pseudomonadales bacterium]
MDFSVEQSYFELWQKHYDATRAPKDWLAASGALAGSLSEVFMAGYQTAMRCQFGINDSAWAAFCVSEGVDGLPPVVQDDAGLLTGVKTWVAAASVVTSFWVKVGRGSESFYVVLPRETKGLSLTLNRNEGFLPELCVGRLHLEKVTPPAPQGVSKAALKQFPKLEASCILIASLGFFASQGFTWASDALARHSAPVIDERSDAALAALALDMQTLIKTAPELAARVPGWHRDRRLIEMYLGMILK